MRRKLPLATGFTKRAGTAREFAAQKQEERHKSFGSHRSELIAMAICNYTENRHLDCFRGVEEREAFKRFVAAAFRSYGIEFPEFMGRDCGVGNALTSGGGAGSRREGSRGRETRAQRESITRRVPVSRPGTGMVPPRSTGARAVDLSGVPASMIEISREVVSRRPARAGIFRVDVG